LERKAEAQDGKLDLISPRVASAVMEMQCGMRETVLREWKVQHHY